MRNKFLDFSMINTSDSLGLVAEATDSRGIASELISVTEGTLRRFRILEIVNQVHYFVHKT